MLFNRKTERNAMRAAFAADCDRLLGGQHRFMRTQGTPATQATIVGSISSICASQGLKPSDWRGG
jgi:hypothetical protein